MGWQFRKRIKVIPGVYVNFNKNGISTTVGPRGFSVNFGPDGTHLNTSVPCLGLYNRTPLNDITKSGDSLGNENDDRKNLKYLIEPAYDGSKEIKSESIAQLTSRGFQTLKDTILIAHSEYTEITKSLNDRMEKKDRINIRLIRSRKSVFRFLFRKRIKRLEIEHSKLDFEIDELTEQQNFSTVKLKISNDDTFESLYKQLHASYTLISNCERIWDVTYSKDVDKIKNRSFASQEIRRVEVKASLTHSGLIEIEGLPLRLQNRNGGDLFFYPGFLIIHANDLDFAILDYSEFRLEYQNIQFVETEQMPADSLVLGHTWAKVNKDGSRDKRFSGNYQIPIAGYAQINFISRTGLNESYLFSNTGYAKTFFSALNEYVHAVTMADNMINAVNKKE